MREKAKLEEEKRKQEEEDAAAEKKRKEEEDAAAEKKRKEEEEAAAEKKRKDEEEAAAKRKAEEEEAAAAAAASSIKKGSRARSDSAPLGYGLTSWPTRPRSGSGLAPRGMGSSPGGSGLEALNGSGRREEVTNIGSFSRGQLPMLSIPSMTKQPSS